MEKEGHCLVNEGHRAIVSLPSRTRTALDNNNFTYATSLLFNKKKTYVMIVIVQGNISYLHVNTTKNYFLQSIQIKISMYKENHNIT